MRENQITAIAAAVDALLIFVVALIMAVLAYRSTTVQNQSFLAYSWRMFAYAAPFAGMAAWRGAANTKRIIAGQPELLRPFLEGLAIMFGAVFLVLMSGAARTAFGAGGIYDDAFAWGIWEWLEYSGFVATYASAAGLIGGTAAVMISLVNKAIVKLCSAS